MIKRWRIGSNSEENCSMIFRDNHCIGMLSNQSLAEEIVEILNGSSKNDREHIAKCLSKEANRIFNKQEKDFPSNILDIVGNNIRMGKDEFLTVKS